MPRMTVAVVGRARLFGRPRSRRTVADAVRHPLHRQAGAGGHHSSGAGFARAGLAGAGPLGSARAPRGRGDQRSAGGAGRPRDPAAGRQRDRCRRRGRRGARRHLAERHRHRRRSVRAGLVGERQEALRARLGGWAPAGWTPQFFTDRLRVKSVPEQRRQRGDRAGRDLRLRRAAEEVRDARRSRRRSSGRPASPRKAGASPSGGTMTSAAPSRACSRIRTRARRFSPAMPRRRSTASSGIPVSRRRCG